MWGLDRFSTHSSAQSSPGPSRPYSPAPRKSNLGPSRPPLSARESSILGPSRTSSNAGLSKSSRPAVTRREEQPAAPADVEDPIAALGRIVGKTHLEGDGDSGGFGPTSKPTTVDVDVQFEGLSLQEYADRHVQAQTEVPNVLPYSQRSIEEYEQESSTFEDLHKSITGCDDVLQSVEKYLSSFQTDLAAVSAEIETLQSRSTSLNERLEKRKQVEKELSPVVDHVVLPPTMVKKISEGAIDETWVKYLDDLLQRSKALDAAKDLDNVKAVKDLRPILDSLCDRAVERIRDYFAAQIRALRSPNINAQIIQQQGFLRFQPLYAFLAKKQPELAEDMMQAYSNTMRWYYHTHFSRYHATLSKLKLFAIDRHDVLGEDPASAAKAKGSTATPTTDNFSLARRVDILKAPATTAMPSHAAEDSRATHHLETPFLAYNLALIDNASFEYIFLNNFFTTRRAPPSSTSSLMSNVSTNHASVVRHFNVMFNPVINIGTTLTKTLVSESFDAIGLLITVRLIQQFAFTLQRRKVPTLDSYINGTNMLLWPRFQTIMDANGTSLRQLTSSVSTRTLGGTSNAAGAIASFGGGSSANAVASTAPHAVTQRFANFVRGIIDLSSEAADNEPVSNSLRRLRTDYEALLTKLGGSFGSGEKGRREGKRFMANNYSLILAVLADAKGYLADETRARFEELKADLA